MFKKTVVIMIVCLVALGGVSFAMCGMCGTSHGKTTAASTSAAVKSGTVNAGNKICPVTGEAVDPKNPVTYEYKGKVYNFCCKMCIEAFKKDPAEYIAIVEKEKSGEKLGEEHSTHEHAR